MFMDYVVNIIMQGLLGMYAGSWSEPVRIAAYVIAIILIVVSSYLLGSLNFAIIISSTQYKQDIRDFGSNNAGMTNMMRTYGRSAAAWTLIGDALKAVVSCLIGYLFIGQLGAYIGGLFCVLGHIFPIYYKFKGGKGVVTAGITMMMCNPIVFLITITLFALIVLIWRYISLASIMCMFLYPILTSKLDPIWLKILTGEDHGSVGVLFATLTMILIVAKHWTNIKRLLNREENKFSFKKSVKKPVKQEEADKPVEEVKEANEEK